MDRLKVFRSGIPGVDINVSMHNPTEKIVTSFLTDDLDLIMGRLNAASISFEGPKESHLGMSSIEFRDPDGFLIKVNQPTDKSPSWLTI